MLVAVRCRALPQQTCDLTKPCDAAMNWTFTVSDKQNTVSAFASTTATTHLAYRPLPTTPCRSTFPENAPLPILAFLHHPLSYRSRQAAPLPCKLAVLESLFTPSFIVFATSAPTTCTNVHRVWRAITVCRFTTRSALGATMRCVRPSHWFVLSLTFTCRPFIGRRISLQLRKPRRPWQDHARTQRHHRRHHSDGGDAPQPRLASPRFVMWVSKSGQCSHFPYHGLPTVSLTSTTLIPALTNTSFQHQVSEQPKHRRIQARQEW